MKPERFNEIVERRVEEFKKLLIPKGEEYSRDDDRLHNFKHAGTLKKETPERALLGMWIKQLVSIFDFIDDLDVDRKEWVSGEIEILKTPLLEVLAEKMNDNHNYLLLLEALFVERIEAQPVYHCHPGEVLIISKENNHEQE